MQSKQVLMVTESEDVSKGVHAGAFPPTEAGGTVPPDSFGNVLCPTMNLVFLGTVKIFLPLQSERKVFSVEEGARGQRIVAEKEDLRTGKDDGEERKRAEPARVGDRIWKKPAGMCEDRNRIARIREYIFAHYTEQLTLKALAELFSLKPNELDHLFREAEGVGVLAFLEETRLERAAALLRGTDREVSSIAMGVGFSSSAYFCTRFRKAYGMTPSQYRRKINREAKTNR